LLSEDRLAKFDPQKLKAIVVDEAHHAAAPSYARPLVFPRPESFTLPRYRRLLSYFDPNIKNPDPDFKPPVLPHKIPIIGFSATFSRHDGLALGSVFERIVYHRDFLGMIKEQWCVSPLLLLVLCSGHITGFPTFALHLFVQTLT
jgi:ATP-dependent helicase IRC3